MYFKKVDQFKYLGTIINSTSKNEMKEELEKRLHAGNACYFAVSDLLKSRNLSQNDKLKIYKSILLPLALYGCETWTLTKV